jgi:hypothetical protein
VSLRSLIVAAAIALALALAPAASAAGWKQVTASDGANTDQVSLLRTGDGTLHVAWRSEDAGGGQSLWHTAIGRDGRIAATSMVVAGWADIQNPAMVSAPGGIRMFWGGIRTTNPNETNTAMSAALSPDGGTTWALQEGNVVQDNAQAYASPTAAATLPDGTPLQTWYGTNGTWVHSGLTPNTPNFDLQAPLGSYGYLPGIAVDSGRPVVAWYSSAKDHLGVYAQDVAADGSPIGGAVNMPGTSNMEIGQTGRTPVAARAGGGLFVAYATGYPSLNRIRVWRVGNAASTLLAKADGGASATVAPDANGRLWVVWEDDHEADPLVFARRSNKAASAWGAVVAASRPKGSISAYSVDASALGDSTLDVFGSFALNSGKPLATFTRRILPGLTVVAKGTPRRGRDAKVEFTVLDAGDPVKGVKVKAGGDSGTSSAKGKVTLTVHAAGGKLTVHATAPGYTPAARTLKVKR